MTESTKSTSKRMVENLNSTDEPVKDAELVNMAVYKIILPDGMALNSEEMYALCERFNQSFIEISKDFRGMRLIFNPTVSLAGGMVVPLVD
jgi:hypothetical protein